MHNSGASSITQRRQTEAARLILKSGESTYRARLPESKPRVLRRSPPQHVHDERRHGIRRQGPPTQAGTQEKAGVLPTSLTHAVRQWLTKAAQSCFLGIV